ncbi:MAG TPA: hypothetical protein VL200_02660 [Lacunisphaera sp.]|jgi:hypothetical protein|nr:hypothetical protein [Lacunisphaera sp.]
MEQSGRIPRRWQMFLLSFTALFLELMVIRWVPSVVRLVAYYANLMLLSSFLGLGVGAIAAGRKWRLFAWFPALLASELGLLLLGRHLSLGTSAAEMRFGATTLHPASYGILAAIFAVNALVFVPIGQRMGAIFGELPRLTAYAWDLGGSLAGTLCFGLFSLLHFSPLAGMAGVMLLHLPLAPRRSWRWSVPLFGLVLAGMTLANNPATRWSPYYHILVRDALTDTAVSGPAPAGLTTMHDPPIYVVSVNRDFYHQDASQNPSRYTPGSPGALLAAQMIQQYALPHQVGGPRRRVLVVGAGGGADVQAALAAGATHVDAVEIDPVLVAISRRYNADAPYDDPRVKIHVDDARSFFSKAAPGYDLVTFGYLDSQALFSYMSNVRLDGFVYTVESIRAAFRLLQPDGMLALSFGITNDWMILKLYRMVEQGTGRPPLLYTSPGQVVLCVPRAGLAAPPDVIGHFRRAVIEGAPPIDVPTDDWPFLYLSRKTIPTDYVMVIGLLLALSLAAVGFLRGRGFGREDLHFALLGMGFLLLETKSIGDCSLYFGTTWFVTLIVVTGVLLMVLAANLVAGRLREFSPRLYLPLFAALALLCLVPRDQVLTFGLAGRLAWALFAVPLPVFFAGLVFSTRFRDTPNAPALFGANLIGAMTGGFAEYLGMALGTQALGLLVIAAYAGSLLCVLRAQRA